ncbi:hypothetical protein T07_12365 [Trichinella nelsoni]|uniref:Uncharacterized protein n=1 Tax=Trichinella nelsoni TaxID=6336 RepID=A0A0V0RBR7_9BILA|nr:hypothetical protein T07_12365 [Trichinella nelsoni]
MVYYVFTYMYAMLFMCQRKHANVQYKKKKSENRRNQKKQ